MMIYLAHISDLHLTANPQWNNMKNAILYSIKKQLKGVPRGKKLLVITGDFHNYMQDDYIQAENFLLQLFDAMDIEPDKDVFVIPGNHDMSKQEKNVIGVDDKKVYLEAIKSNPILLSQCTDKLLSYYDDYIKFVQTVGIYPSDCGRLPVSVHVRTWRDKLHLLHLNTTLLADGGSKNDQMVDILTATSDNIRRALAAGNLPCVAVGHNSFFDLHDSHQTALSAMFLQENISAYLCGDRHKRNTIKSENKIELSNKYGSASIPNIVSYRSSADADDTYSDFGMIWQIWNEDTGHVTLNFMKWDPRDQGELQPDGVGDYYTFRDLGNSANTITINEKKENRNNISDSTNIINSIEADKADKDDCVAPHGREVKTEKRTFNINLRQKHPKLFFLGTFLLILLCFIFITFNFTMILYTDIKPKEIGKIPVEEVYAFSENEEGLLELNLSNMELSDISFLEQYDLSGVERIDLSENDLLCDIAILKNIKNLKEINLSSTGVDNISALKGLSNLEILLLSDTEICDISCLSELKRIKELDVGECNKLKDVQVVSELPNLRSLDIGNCQNDDIWKKLPILPRLELLDVSNYEFKGEFDFSLYPSLTALNLWGSDVQNLADLSTLHKLKSLNIVDAVFDLSGLEQFTKLEELRYGGFLAEDADHIILEHMETLSSLKLKTLDFFTKNDKNLKGLSNVSGLEELDIWAVDCDLEDFSFLENNKDIKSLSLRGEIKKVPSKIGEMERLKNLSINDSRYLSDDVIQELDFSFLRNCTNLEKLELTGGKLSDISFLESCRSLKELVLSEEGIKDFSVIESLYDLQKLELGETSRLKDFEFLKDLENMEELTIGGCELADFHGLSGLTKLKKLSLPDAKILSASFLKNLTNLQYLDLSGNFDANEEEFGDISFVRQMKQLRFLNLSYRKINDLSPLSALNQLLVLDLSNGNTESDLFALTGMTSLNNLQLSTLKIKNLKPLASLKYLGTLDLEDCFFGAGAEWDFGGFVNLQKLNIRGSTIATLNWLKDCNSLRYIDVRNTMVDDLKKQLSSLIREKEKFTVIYNTSTLSQGQLAEMKKINKTCIWEEEDY